MFVDEGINLMLDAQLSYLGTCYWKLYPANTTITRTTVLADLGAEASWGGYGTVLSGTWTDNGIIGPGSQATNTTPPLFFNTSGSGQTFYVVALVDVGASKIVWCDNVGGPTIPDGGIYALNPIVKDQQL